MSAHTPGPWHVGGAEGATIYDRMHQRVANSFDGVMVAHCSDERCKANARLIAAAPELLEALRVAYADLQRCSGHTIDMLGRVEAVIVKATQP